MAEFSSLDPSAPSRSVSPKLRRLRRFLAGASSLTLGVAALLSPTGAFAQTVRVIEPIQRSDREPGLDPYTINYAECISNENIVVGLGFTDIQNLTLEVWAGRSSGNCSDDMARAQNVQTGLCWPIRSGLPQDFLTLSTQDILNRGEEEGRPACGPPADGEVLLYFMLLRGDENVTTQTPTLTFQYDLEGPVAPVLTGIGSGENRLFPTWTPSPSADLLGYRVYCEPSDPLAGAESCSAPTLQAGMLPPSELRKGNASANATKGEASGLENFVTYACGVAGYDELGNLGVLSAIQCGTPEPIIDYFEAYRAAGGQAGGGFCRFGRAPAGSAGLLLAAAALGFGLRRRRAA